MKKAVWGAGLRVVAVIGLTLAQVSCGSLTTQGTASSYLIIKELSVESGADPGKFGSTLFSDVVTIVKDGEEKFSTVFADNARVSFGLGLKDPGAPTSPNSPSQNNAITIDRYHVEYIRADGRNTPGVDVPYPFDSAIAVTVLDDVTHSFEIVRHVAKEEAPLGALAGSAVIINTITRVTFYGHDQTGRSVSATAQVGIEFGNFADPTK
jgi:hypothetical protein